MVMACPMPISRSRDRASPAMLMDRQAKNADPSTTNTPTPVSLTGLWVSDTPSSAEITMMTTAWTRDLGQFEPPYHAARVGLDQAPGGVVQAHRAQHLRDTLAALPARH